MSEEYGGLVESPDGAVYREDQDLHDAADPSRCFSVTVHKLEKGRSATNFWIRERGEWRRLMPEQVLSRSPNLGMLQGEMLRAVMDDQLTEAMAADNRLLFCYESLRDSVGYRIESESSGWGG